MLRKSWVVAAITLTLAGRLGEANAGRWSLHGVGTASGGWTDNVENLPDGTADFFYEAAPGALFTVDSPRMIHELSYEFRYRGYAERTEANSYSNRALWRGFFLISPRLEASVEAALQAGETNAFRPLGAPTMVEITPAQTDYIASGVTEIMRFQWTRNWRLTQGLVARRMDASDSRGETDGTDIQLSLGGDRSWKRDGVGVTLTIGYVDLYRLLYPDPPEQPDPEVQEDRAQLDLGAQVAWRRDINEDWASVVAVGTTTIVPLESGLSPVVSPTAQATIAYLPVWGNLRLSGQHTVTPNLFVAENTISSAVSLQGWLPIPLLAQDPLEPIFGASAALGAAHLEMVDLATDERESANSYLADVALHYSPVRRTASVSLRYTFFHQDEDPAVEEPRFESFTRHSIMIQLAGRWPEETAGVYPHRDVLRVDEADRTPVGIMGEGDAASGPAQPR